MELYTAEINRLEQLLEDDPFNEEVRLKYAKYLNKRSLVLERLRPSAIKVIEFHLNRSYITYKATGAKVLVKKQGGTYYVWSRYGAMPFRSIESVADFLIMSEDLFV